MPSPFQWLFLHTRNALSSSDREEFVAQQTDPNTGEVRYSLERIAHWPEAAVALLTDQLRGWCAAKADARVLLGSLATIDARLGVWCAAAVVERSMIRRTSYVDPAREALDVARAWALGRATPEQCQRAADAARTFASERDVAAEARAAAAANEAAAYAEDEASLAFYAANDERERSRRASLAAYELAYAAAAVASAAANPTVNAAHVAMVATRVAAAAAHTNNVAATEDLRAQCATITEAVSRAVEALARGA